MYIYNTILCIILHLHTQKSWHLSVF